MTAAELIAELSKGDTSRPVVIHDADTGWPLAVLWVQDDGDSLRIGGEYFHELNPRS